MSKNQVLPPGTNQATRICRCARATLQQRAPLIYTALLVVLGEIKPVRSNHPSGKALIFNHDHDATRPLCRMRLIGPVLAQADSDARAGPHINTKHRVTSTCSCTLVSLIVPCKHDGMESVICVVFPTNNPGLVNHCQTQTKENDAVQWMKYIISGAFAGVGLKDRVNTGNMSRRRNMHLNSYVCELFIVQRNHFF
jgi:hypothetical protein